MAEDPGGEENHLLVVGLRIALVVLVVVAGILIVGNVAISVFHLKEDVPSIYSGEPVPVSPISESPSVATPTTTPTSLPTLTYPAAPTDIPTVSEVPPGLVLNASSTVVRSGQAVTFSGTYAGRNGTVLQLQRLQDDIWYDYPNEITVDMGTYTTTASSTLAGTNSFRVYDQSGDEASNVVSILVR